MSQVATTVRQTTPIDAPDRRCRRPWSEVPLRAKLVLLVVLAAVAGCLVGMMTTHLGLMHWPLSLGLSLVVGVFGWLGHRWVWRPIDRLLRQAEQLSQTDRSRSFSKLPLARRDEVGQLARAMHALIISALRDHHEARRLRRTLDSRIEQATQKATRQLRQIAMRDALTNLANRRFLDENLEILVQSVKDSHADLICIVLDMDDFKLVNDTLGHAAGDELLVFLASLIRACSRQEDYVIRLGGDEFVVLMPECEHHRVQQFTSQLSALFRQHVQTALPSHVQTDISMGIASLKRDGAGSGKKLLEIADSNLYGAKRSGKAQAVGV